MEGVARGVVLSSMIAEKCFYCRLQEALARCATSIENSAQEVQMLHDDITAAAAATADGSATSDLQDLKLLSSAQARLSNIVQVRAAASWQNCDSSQLSAGLDSERAAAVQNAATGASSGAGQLAACGRPVVPVPRPSVAARQPALPSPHARTHR